MVEYPPQPIEYLLSCDHPLFLFRKIGGIEARREWGGQERRWVVWSGNAVFKALAEGTAGVPRVDDVVARDKAFGALYREFEMMALVRAEAASTDAEIDVALER